MKKKAAESAKQTDPQNKKGKGFHAAGTGPDATSRAPKPIRVGDDPRFAHAVQSYEAGLKALQIHKYDKAKAHFEKVLAGPSGEMVDRATVHLNTCNQQMSRSAANFRTPEEQFDFAVSLMNMGDYVTARENFDILTKTAPKLDFVWYGMAALNCLTGRFPEAINGLNEAIRLNPSNRYQARNDSDFKNLADDPRFTELLYPDSSAEAAPEADKWRY